MLAIPNTQETRRTFCNIDSISDSTQHTVPCIQHPGSQVYNRLSTSPMCAPRQAQVQCLLPMYGTNVDRSPMIQMAHIQNPFDQVSHPMGDINHTGPGSAMIRSNSEQTLLELQQMLDEEEEPDRLTLHPQPAISSDMARSTYLQSGTIHNSYPSHLHTPTACLIPSQSTKTHPVTGTLS